MNPHRTITRFAATVLVTAAYVALCAVSVGCGGSNNSTDSGSTSVVSAFTPDTPVPADGSITMLQGATSGAAVSVRVTVTQIPSFFGAAFRVAYDPTALLFNGMDHTTSFLNNGVSDPNNQLLFTVDAASTLGELVIAATRLDPTVAPPINVTTTSDLVILNFVARRAIVPLAVEGRLDFADPKQACDGSVVAPGCGSITVTAWKGGGVSAQ